MIDRLKWIPERGAFARIRGENEIVQIYEAQALGHDIAVAYPFIGWLKCVLDFSRKNVAKKRASAEEIRSQKGHPLCGWEVIPKSKKDQALVKSYSLDYFQGDLIEKLSITDPEILNYYTMRYKTGPAIIKKEILAPDMYEALKIAKTIPTDHLDQIEISPWNSSFTIGYRIVNGKRRGYKSATILLKDNNKGEKK